MNTDNILNNIIFIFYITSLFLFLLTTFFSALKIYEFFNDFRNNKLLEDDFERGVSFKKFITEIKRERNYSSFARVIYDGYNNFNDAYTTSKYNFGSPILIAKTSMKERLYHEVNQKNKFLNIFLFSSFFILYAGFIFFLLEIIKNNNDVFFINIINNLYILIISLSISMYSSLIYFLLKSHTEYFYNKNRLLIESFLKFIHKEIIIKNE